jgi:hypothetical protein
LRPVGRACAPWSSHCSKPPARWRSSWTCSGDRYGGLRMRSTSQGLPSKDSGTDLSPISRRLRASLEMLRYDPAGREFGPSAFVFGTETGKKIKSVKTAWRLACRRAGIDGLSIHDLRREAASSLHESGMPPAYVRVPRPRAADYHVAVYSGEPAGDAGVDETGRAESEGDPGYRCTTVAHRSTQPIVSMS